MRARPFRRRAGSPQLPVSGPSVFAFKFAPNPLQHGPLGVVRSLGRLGVVVHANYEVPRAPVRLSRYAADGVVWRQWPQSSGEAVERLITWASEQAERPVLIPVDDASAVVVAEHAKELEPHFAFSRQNAALARELSDKLELARRCEQLGVPSPRTIAPQSAEEAVAVAGEFAFPVVVKRIANRSQRDYEEPSVRILADAGRLVQLWQELAERGSADNYLLQEFIPGGPESVWMFNGYFDDDSRCLVSYTGFKLRQYPPGRGPTTLGECRRNDEVSEQAERLFSGLGYRGVVDAGFRYDARDGLYKVLDVNPRLGASFRLFVAPSGTDVVRALYLDLTGKPVPDDRPDDGRRWLVEPWDLRSSLQQPRGLYRWPFSLRGVRELAWIAVDDPMPAFAMAVALCKAALRLVPGAFSRSRPTPEAQPERAPSRA